MLQAAVQRFCEQQGCEPTYWIAYSGGLDSHVLLTLLCALRHILPLKLQAIHVNHNLSPQAPMWAQHCKRVCEALQVSYVEHTLQLDCQTGDSLEAVAREQRYRALAAYLKKDDILLTAHHQDDQAETVLLQLMRGAGLKGLAAMPAIKTFDQGFHARPLLNFARAALEDYARMHSLTWIEDESNTNLNLTRNFIRHEVLTLLKKRWPTVTATLSRSANHCAAAENLLHEYALEDVQNPSGTAVNTLSVHQLLLLSPERQRQVLRAWIQVQDCVVPDSKKMETIQQTVLTAQWDRRACVEWGDVSLRRHRDDLYVMKKLVPLPTEKRWHWDLSSSLTLPAIGELRAALVTGTGLRFDIKQVSVSFRQGGEWLALANRGRHTLKNCFQEWNVLPWMRERIPLLFIGEQLIGVVGYYLDEAYAAKQDEPGWEIRLER